MNVNNINITGINDLSEDVELLKSEFSTLSDVVDNLPNTYANLTLFSTLSTDYDDYKISNGTNISILNIDIENIQNNYVTNSSFSTLSDDYNDYKIINSTNISILNLDIQNIF